jgi:hypothetical protein
MVLYHKKSGSANTLLIGIIVGPRVHALETALTVINSTYLFLAVVTRKPSSQPLSYKGIM